MAIKRGRCLRWLFRTVVVCCTVIALSSVAFAEESDEELNDKGVEEINSAYEFTVETSEDAVGASAGISSGGWASLGSSLSYMRFPEDAVSPDGEDGVWCYCIDITTSTENGHKYSVTTLDAAEYYEDEVSGKIRSILLNSYPNIGTEELAKNHDLTELMEEEAFIATQWILWYYSNPEGLVEAGEGVYYPANIYKPSEYPKDTTTIWYEDGQGNEIRKQSENVVKLAKALDALPSAEAYETEPANIAFEKKVYDNKVVFDFGGTTGLETLENIKFTVKDGQGSEVPFAVKGSRIEVQYADIKMVDDAAELTVDAEAIQTLSKDVYFFAPEGGRSASQSRVAVYEGSVPVASSAAFSLTSADFEEAGKDPEEEHDGEAEVPSIPEDPTGGEGDGTRDDPYTNDRAQEVMAAVTDTDKTPGTGDDSNMLLLAAVAAAALTGAGLIFFKRKRE